MYTCSIKSIIGSCPGEMTFEPIMNQCYQVITDKMTQPEAMDYCSQLFPSVHLVDLESSTEHTLVNSLVEAAAPLGKCPAVMDLFLIPWHVIFIYLDLIFNAA